MYGDIILNNSGILERIPKDIVIVDWHYNAAETYPSVGKFRRAGYDVIVSPGLSNWSRFYPFRGTALDNIENLTREGFRQGALGAVTSSWCDFGAPNLRQAARFGLAFAASCAWNPEVVDRPAFERTFWRQFFAVEDPQPFIRLDEILSTVGRSAFDDWWRHPVIGPSPRGMIALHKDGAAWGASLREKAATARIELQKARTAAKANLWFLDIFSLTIDMCDLLGAKFIWMDNCTKAGPGRLPAATADNLSRSARGAARPHGRAARPLLRPLAAPQPPRGTGKQPLALGSPVALLGYYPGKPGTGSDHRAPPCSPQVGSLRRPAWPARIPAASARHISPRTSKSRPGQTA